jgi:hypothetical protein
VAEPRKERAQLAPRRSASHASCGTTACGAAGRAPRGVQFDGRPNRVHTARPLVYESRGINAAAHRPFPTRRQLRPHADLRLAGARADVVLNIKPACPEERPARGGGPLLVRAPLRAPGSRVRRFHVSPEASALNRPDNRNSRSLRGKVRPARARGARRRLGSNAVYGQLVAGPQHQSELPACLPRGEEWAAALGLSTALS